MTVIPFEITTSIRNLIGWKTNNTKDALCSNRTTLYDMLCIFIYTAHKQPQVPAQNSQLAVRRKSFTIDLTRGNGHDKVHLIRREAVCSRFMLWIQSS